MAYRVSFREASVANLAYNALRSHYHRADRENGGGQENPFERIGISKRDITLPDEAALSVLERAVRKIRVSQSRKRDPKKYTVEEVTL